MPLICIILYFYATFMHLETLIIKKVSKFLEFSFFFSIFAAFFAKIIQLCVICTGLGMRIKLINSCKEHYKSAQRHNNGAKRYNNGAKRNNKGKNGITKVKTE